MMDGKLNALAERVHRNSYDHGFWNTANTHPNPLIARTERDTQLAGMVFTQKLALIHSEVSEALEAHREFGFTSMLREDGKPEGVASELTDIIIRVLDLTFALEIDIEHELNNKIVFNESRPHMHGKGY